MTPSRRHILFAGSILTISGCASRPQSPLGPRSIGLVDAFKGRQSGIGVFRVPIAGVERRFRAVLTGTLHGNTLTVAEDFRFDDGEIQHLTWRFTREGKGVWSGRRDDTVGDVQIIETGTEIRLDYTADIRSRGDTTRLSFSDVVWRRQDGVIVNEAIVKKVGVPVGTVEFELRR